MPYKDLMQRRECWRKSQRKHRGQDPDTPKREGAPWYNAEIHKGGERVMIRVGKEIRVVIVPKEGQNGIQT